MRFNLQYLPESQVAVALECVVMVCSMCGGGKKALKCENEQIFAHSFPHLLPPPHDQWLDGTDPPCKHYKLESPILKHQYQIVGTAWWNPCRQKYMNEYFEIEMSTFIGGRKEAVPKRKK
jgi:hypothetical protein